MIKLTALPQDKLIAPSLENGGNKWNVNESSAGLKHPKNMWERICSDFFLQMIGCSLECKCFIPFTRITASSLCKVNMLYSF